MYSIVSLFITTQAILAKVLLRNYTAKIRFTKHVYHVYFPRYNVGYYVLKTFKVIPKISVVVIIFFYTAVVIIYNHNRRLITIKKFPLLTIGSQSLFSYSSKDYKDISCLKSLNCKLLISFMLLWSGKNILVQVILWTFNCIVKE